MPKAFSFASWNVEHFGDDPTRVDRAVDLLLNADPDGGGAPDVFAIYEVEGKQVFDAFMQKMPTHSFFITEAHILQNILVGLRNGITGFVTQREKLQSGMPTLRPGMLATISVNQTQYSLLFLHLKADDAPRSWGLRDHMSTKIQSLKNALDGKANVPDGANFLVMGDFNNVGMDVTFSDRDFTQDEEMERYVKRFTGKKLRLLNKTANLTFSNGSGSSTPPANLDHVFASKHLKFKKFAGGAEVAVRGWPELPTVAAQDKFIADLSDHALLYGEVHT